LGHRKNPSGVDWETHDFTTGQDHSAVSARAISHGQNYRKGREGRKSRPEEQETPFLRGVLALNRIGLTAECYST
jgi:hypothetical protein